MPSFNDTLNNVIAVVVVILILSLLVQSVQSVVKKFFKIKSRQIEESLVDLFANMLNLPGFQPNNWLDRLIDHSPMWRIIFFRRPSPAQQAGVEEIFNKVVDGFKDVGRLAHSGSHMLDSISKGDLVKILEKVPIDNIIPAFVDSVESAFDEIANLQIVIQNIKQTAQKGEANDAFQSILTSYQTMELMLGPMFCDVQAIIANDAVPQLATSPPQQSARLLVRDMKILSEIDVDRLQKLLEEMKTSMSHTRQSVPEDSATGKAIVELEKGLQNIASTADALRSRLAPAVVAFQVKTREASEWYDIVMQSFEERYSRSMKSWAVVIAFLVVAVLNANFFNIYRNIATSEVTRNLLVEKGGDVLKTSQQRNAEAAAAEKQTATQAGTQTTTQSAGQPTTQTTAPPVALNQEAKDAKDRADKEKTDKAKAEAQQDAKDELKSAIQLVKSDTEIYKGMGFSPLRWQQVKDWFSSLTPDTNTEQPWGLWWRARKHDLSGLLGWIIMTILLSIGAPFWQDTLESLFGVKNLLRQKGEIKNVEQQRGSGQPKP